MSGTSATPAPPPAPVRRVRHEVRDQALVMLFTLGASALLTLALMLLVR